MYNCLLYNVDYLPGPENVQVSLEFVNYEPLVTVTWEVSLLILKIQIVVIHLFNVHSLYYYYVIITLLCYYITVHVIYIPRNSLQ